MPFEKVIYDWAQSQPEITRAIVFGSRVRAEHRPDSDLDVAVEIIAGPGDTDAFTTWISEAKVWRAQLGMLLPFPVDLQWHDPGGTTPRITAGLAQSSRVIFDRLTSN